MAHRYGGVTEAGEGVGWRPRVIDFGAARHERCRRSVCTQSRPLKRVDGFTEFFHLVFCVQAGSRLGPCVGLLCKTYKEGADLHVY